MVVVVLPLRAQTMGDRQTFEFFDGKELIAKPAVETLGVAVLPGRRGLDEQGLHGHVVQPALQAPGNEFRTVVAADASRDSTHGEQLRKRVDHILAGDAAIDLQRQAFPRGLIHDRQPLECRAAARVIEHEVPAPHVISTLSPDAMTAVVTRAQTAFSRFF